MKPYKNLKSKNLSLVLLIARIFAGFGMFMAALFLASMACSVASLFFPLTSLWLQILNTSGYLFLILSILAFLISGIFAAIVSIEENHRLKTELLLKSQKQN
ncbi:hypothetical protein PAHA111176_05320 [Parendozoicomonas haliclonae]|uniref:Uncharacterized protein n=1 Tax=Parendozoicomonas haliclonae TaxID=1960125 RepID=A0A1X7AK19_9GAMM|nr:hypothetical protein EHSB41UT_02426 [Parendozoicomonas haliclonae]